MRSIQVYHFDAFSNKPNKGNPAGVVLNSETLTEEEMQQIAYAVGFNETAFSMKSDVADIRIRYFTPGHEINVCGHATMATIYALKTEGLLGNKTELSIETKAGILNVLLFKEENEWYITMDQARPQFQAFQGSLDQLAKAMGIELEDIVTSMPTMYGNTGAWTLIVPVKSLDACKRMKPNNSLFPSILTEIPTASVHPFCLETYDSRAHMHARHFSSPYSGTIEDPVTGTASGVMGAYYVRYIGNQEKFLIEQGQEIGKDGRIRVNVTKDGEDVKITGNAVYVKTFEVVIR